MEALLKQLLLQRASAPPPRGTASRVWLHQGGFTSEAGNRRADSPIDWDPARGVPVQARPRPVSMGPSGDLAYAMYNAAEPLGEEGQSAFGRGISAGRHEARYGDRIRSGDTSRPYAHMPVPGVVPMPDRGVPPMEAPPNRVGQAVDSAVSALISPILFDQLLRRR